VSDEESVGRQALIAALVAQEAADRACRGALVGGASFRVWAAGVSVTELILTYDRRVRHLAHKGIVALGADTVVDRLRSIDGEQVRLGLVNSEDFNFTLFLDLDQLRVQACVGVTASTANPDWDWSSLSS
jgi:hypothetical protein